MMNALSSEQPNCQAETPAAFCSVTPNREVIHVYLRKAFQLFNALDPSPFSEKDLAWGVHRGHAAMLIKSGGATLGS